MVDSKISFAFFLFQENTAQIFKKILLPTEEMSLKVIPSFLIEYIVHLNNKNLHISLLLTEYENIINEMCYLE